jgi:glycine/D-amino acid oxidase-like deaminating enzyme/nitrite reductase/ring-hydroxylating ferredoxin subunit
MMNAAVESSKSLWMDLPAPRAATLDDNVSVDVVVVGSGIAGISTAYELSEAGISVAVVDRGDMGRGITSRTTAHLTFSHDDTYDEVISKHGEESAKNILRSQKTAIDRLEIIQREERVACDFLRVDGYLFAPSQSDVSTLEAEIDACKRIGLKAEWARGLPIEGPYAKALCFPEQAHFHPLKYLYGLIHVLRKRNVKFFAHSPVIEITELESSIVAKTERGSISANNVVLATNSPIANRIVVHDKQAPYRTYAFAGSIKRGALPDALFWDTEDPYHYVRLQPGNDKRDHLIVGGEDHKTGEADDADVRFERLEAWARKYFPMLEDVTHRWSGQVMDTFDYLPFIGKNPGHQHTFIATGDSGQGFTNGPLAGLILAGLISRGRHKWSELHDPARKTPAAAFNFVSENITPLKNYVGYLTPGEVSSPSELKRGQGAIMRDGVAKIAVFRDDTGVVHKRSASCTHTGCLVSWNSFEQCWDCPCHGSHFSPTGEVLNGPAMTPLSTVGDQVSGSETGISRKERSS